MSLVTALVLMNINRGKVDTVAQQLIALEGVSEVFSVAGQWDMVAILRSSSNEEIAELVTSKIRDIADITNTQTLLAFKAYARDDMDSMFSIGSNDVVD